MNYNKIHRKESCLQQGNNMKTKKILSMSMVMILAVLLLLSSCTASDVEYAGQMIEDIQSNGIGVLENLTLPPINTTTIVTHNEFPEITTTPSTKKPPKDTTAAQTTVIQTTPAPVVNNDNFTPTVDCPKDGVITTAEQLHAVLVNGATSASYAVNAVELDMEGLGWQGMDNFSGTFDFGCCTIKNASYPLFRKVNGGTVKNLVIAESSYVCTNEQAISDINPATGENTNPYYSPVVCYAKDITISNVIIESSVSVRTDLWFEQTYHGGIVACAEGLVKITDCHFKGEFTTDSMYVRFGGVAGHIGGVDASAVNAEDLQKSSVLVYNCSNSGIVKNLAFGFDSKTAGVIGSIINGVILNSANYGEIINDDCGQSAGVVGYVGGTTYVKNCINTAKVTGASFVGGICGYSNGNDRVFENCLNIGEVYSDNKTYGGGLLGVARKAEKFINCFDLAQDGRSFLNHMGASTVFDENDPTTYADLQIVNSSTVSTVEQMLEKINAVAPGVFIMSANKLIILA